MAILGGLIRALGGRSRTSPLVDLYVMTLDGAWSFWLALVRVAGRLGRATPLAPIVVVRFVGVGIVDEGRAAPDVVSKEV